MGAHLKVERQDMNILHKYNELSKQQASGHLTSKY